MAVSKTDSRGVVEVFDAPRYTRTHPDARLTTCGECGRTWDDAVGTAWTPAPSARCVFEYDHEDVPAAPSPLQRIADILAEPSWSVGMLEDIAAIVNGAGVEPRADREPYYHH